MKTGVKVFLIIFSLIIAGAIVIGVDVYLSYKAYGGSLDDFDISTPTYIIASDNESVTLYTTVTTPKFGYIPKSAKIGVIIEKSGVEYNEPTIIKLKLGGVQDIEFTIQLGETERDQIKFGMQVTFTIKISAIPVYLGIPLNFLYLELDPITQNIQK